MKSERFKIHDEDRSTSGGAPGCVTLAIIYGAVILIAAGAMAVAVVLILSR